MSLGDPGAAAPDDRDDATLLAAHVAGDSAAFGVLFARHRDRLWAVALRTMGNPHDAEDALQDALISAFRRADSFQGRSAVTTWLHRIVVNASLDRIRASKSRAADPAGDDLEVRVEQATHSTLSSHGPDGVPDPAESAISSERRDLVLAALAQLPPEQRAALVLVDMEGYPVSEVAVMLDCAEGTVKSRCARGRKTLAALLGQLRPGSPQVPGNQVVDRSVPSLKAPRGPPE